MLLAFAYDSYFDGAECDHINRNPLDNRLSNLRWVSHRDNCRNRSTVKKQKDRALYLVFDDGSVQFYGSRKTTNIPSPTLSRILNGKHSQKYKCRGFYWDDLEKQPKHIKDAVINYEMTETIF